MQEVIKSKKTVQSVQTSQKQLAVHHSLFSPCPLHTCPSANTRVFHRFGDPNSLSSIEEIHTNNDNGFKNTERPPFTPQVVRPEQWQWRCRWCVCQEAPWQDTVACGELQRLHLWPSSRTRFSRLNMTLSHLAVVNPSMCMKMECSRTLCLVNAPTLSTSCSVFLLP